MRNVDAHGTGRTGRKDHANVQEYVSGLQAAIRTHQRLTGGSPLTVELQDESKLPLAQKILLR